MDFVMAKCTVFLLGLLGLCCQVGCIGNKYDNYTLLKITPHNENHLNALARLANAEGELEILKRSYGLNDTTDVLVSPLKKLDLEGYAASIGMPIEHKHNYGRSFEPVERAPRRRALRSFDVYKYNSYEHIKSYLDSLPIRFPNLVSLQDVGRSFEGRKMQLVKISLNPSARNPIIFVDAGIHSREWAAPAMAIYLINRLTTDPAARNLELNGVDWYILPVVNPDGYEFTRSSRENRLWRKTRSKSSIPNCMGVDGNRNYGFKWGVTGVSHDPCDREVYAGPKAFSEPETQIVRNIMMENAQRIKLYVSLHAYGQYLVYPWGYTGSELPNTWRKLRNLANMVSDAVVRAGGRKFNVMSAGQWYPAAGGSDDFAFGAVGVPYSYTMELTEGFEFTFPEKILRVVMPQYYDGFKTFAIQIRKEFGKE